MLLLSMVVLLPQSAVAAAAAVEIETESVICGQAIWVNISNYNSSEYVKIYMSNNSSVVPGNASGYEQVKRVRTGSSSGTTPGEVNTSINIPWRNATGQYWIQCVGESTGNYTNHSINITDIYDVTVTPDPIMWNNDEYQPYTISVMNWTGSQYSALSEAYGFKLYDPGSTKVDEGTDSDGSITSNAWFNYTQSSNKETNYTLYIYSGGLSGTEVANITVPVRLELQDMSISAASFGDTVTVSGTFVDGHGNPVTSYPVALVTASEGLYGTTVNTNAAGDFAIAVQFNETGTWYIGTLKSGTGRPADAATTKNLSNFIWYDTIEVDPDVGTITIDPDEVTYGFNFSVNIHVKNSQGDALSGAHVNVTGLGCVINGTGYGEDDEVCLGHTDANGWLNITTTYTSGSDANIRFNESGAATFQFWYGGTAANPDVSGSTRMAVTSPGSINTVVTFARNKVLLGDLEANTYDDPPAADDEWGNVSSYMIIEAYGSTLDDPKNVSITIEGCGIDTEYDEDEAKDLRETSGVVGIYNISLSPRNGGTLTVTVHNDTDDVSLSKDYTIGGIVSSTTTSIGDDKEITVNEPEVITFTAAGAYFAEVHVTRYSDTWEYVDTLNVTVGNNTAGNGLNGIYTFEPDCDMLGFYVISARVGYTVGSSQYNYYTYDVVEVAPKHDLVITLVEPTAGNMTLTAGLEYDIALTVANASGTVSSTNMDSVVGQILNETGEVIVDNIAFTYDSGNAWWEKVNWKPTSDGTLLITATAYSGEHDGNNSDIMIELATVTFNPGSLTAGIEWEDVPVNMTILDATGEPIANTGVYGNLANATGTTLAGNSSNPITTDDDGMATIWFSAIGNVEGEFTITLNDEDTGSGYANTTGELTIAYPIITADPETVFLGISNTVTLTAKDGDGNPIEGINLTLVPKTADSKNNIPDPAETNANGVAVLSVTPTASGFYNISIATNPTLNGTSGRYDWTYRQTDDLIEAVNIGDMDIALSASPVMEGETLTVTVTSGGAPVQTATVKMGSLTSTTDSQGKATFTAPDPGADYVTYTVEVTKTGFTKATTQVVVMKVYEISIVAPSTAPKAGESFSVTVIAKGAALAGATVTFNGATVTSGTDGKVTFTAPSETGTYTVTASADGYEDVTASVTIEAGGIPGFEMVTLVAALGVCFILLRRRK